MGVIARDAGFGYEGSWRHVCEALDTEMGLRAGV